MVWILAALVLAVDLITKYYAAAELATQPVELIQGTLELIYVENRGAAWGIFQGARIGFIVLTVLLLGAFVYFYRKRKAEFSVFSKVIFALIISGALGNLIDRIVYGYVRDMIYVSLINFPVFNIADCAIVIGAVLLVIQTLFLKDGIFDIIERHWPRKRNTEGE